MPDIDTSPAALRALADYWGNNEPMGLDPRDGTLVEQLLAETDRRMAQIVATLRAIAAEKAEADRDALAGPLTYRSFACTHEHAVECAYLLSLAEADDDVGDAMTVVSLYVAGDVSMAEAIAALEPANPEDPARD